MEWVSDGGRRDIPGGGHGWQQFELNPDLLPGPDLPQGQCRFAPAILSLIPGSVFQKA